MSIRQQAQFSRLAFTNSNQQEEPTWRRVTDWPPLPGGGRASYASVVTKHPHKKEGQIVVVLGGYECGNDFNHSKSALLLNVDDPDKVWREGRAMNEARVHFAAVVCNGALYAMGGGNEESSLSTIERIGIADLVSSSFMASTQNNNNPQWTTLKCRLSNKTIGCAAAVVKDRFIVVAGGEYEDVLSSVDIIDTTSQSECCVLSGPPMNVGRTFFGMAVIGSRIYAVGGRDEHDGCYQYLSSVEYLDFDDWLKEGPKGTTSMVPFTISTKSWTIHKDIVLGSPRYEHAVVRVGSCLVEVGGPQSETNDLRAGEVLDTQRNMVWQLPKMEMEKEGCDVVALSTGIVTMEGCFVDSGGETLSLMDKNSLCFAGLMALGKAPIRPKLC